MEGRPEPHIDPYSEIAELKGEIRQRGDVLTFIHQRLKPFHEKEEITLEELTKLLGIIDRVMVNIEIIML